MTIQLIQAMHFPIPKGTCMSWINGPNEEETVAMPCPQCGRAFCLSNHTIGTNGVVSPSVVCPYGCGFHEMVTINGRSGN